jgi:hypothetical protein
MAMNAHAANSTKIQQLKPYPTYKDSGVGWLGDIPVHWDVVPIRSLAKSGYKTFTDGDWILSEHLRTGKDVRLMRM